MFELVDCIEDWLSVDILEYSKWGPPAAEPPNQSLEPTRLSRAFVRFVPPLIGSGSRLASLRQPPGGSAPGRWAAWE
jgi:hypothetical protein